MNKTSHLLPIVTLAICSTGFVDSDLVWEKNGQGIMEKEIQAVAISPVDDSTVIVGTQKALYRSTSHGKDFKRIFQVFTGDPDINHIAYDERGSLYVATDSGLYVSEGDGVRFKQIYRSFNKEESRCQRVLPLEDLTLLGTDKGLFIKENGHRNWDKAHGELGGERIDDVAFDGEYYFVATANKLFRSDKELNHFVKVFSANASELDQAQTEETADDGEMADDNPSSRLMISGIENGRIYLASSGRVYFSDTKGESWQRLSGVSLNGVSAIAQLNDGELMFAGESGIECFNEKPGSSCQELEAAYVNNLAIDSKGKVYAATQSGLYHLIEKRKITLASAKLTFLSADSSSSEPSIKEIQDMAIKYAEVHPSKIKNWRTAARNRAFLPTFSVGLSRDAGEYFHWDTGPNPDTLQKGRDYLDWSMSISWNFGDLIWNNDQTSIDSRSKLMVELRENVLDQVTRLYFERRRLQIEFGSLKEVDETLKWDLKLRIDELTALLDGFTGGGFTNSCKQNKEGLR